MSNNKFTWILVILVLIMFILCIGLIVNSKGMWFLFGFLIIAWIIMIFRILMGKMDYELGLKEESK